ncbi:MAG: hypothetical protein J7L44_04055 [Candidatus Diapherotrites archaeon]|nr:hypothetical protein [Candidatus Diapherotrites archaeon]
MRCSLQSPADISKVPRDAESIHIVRPLPYKKMLALIQRCKRLKTISMSASTRKRLARKVKRLLEEKGLRIMLTSERGRAIGIPLAKMKQAIEMRRDFRPLREIEEVTGIPKSTVHYLEKYSLRRKIKRGHTIIYLK